MDTSGTLTNNKVALGISANDGVFMHGPHFHGKIPTCPAQPPKCQLSLLMNNNIPEKILN